MKKLKKIISLLLLSLFITAPACVGAEIDSNGYEKADLLSGQTIKAYNKDNEVPDNYGNFSSMTDANEGTAGHFYGNNIRYDWNYGAKVSSAMLRTNVRNSGEGNTSKADFVLSGKLSDGSYVVLDTKTIVNDTTTRDKWTTLDYSFDEIELYGIKIDRANYTFKHSDNPVQIAAFRVYTEFHTMLGETGKTIPVSDAKGVSNAGAVDKRTENIEVIFGKNMDTSTLVAGNISITPALEIPLIDEDISKTETSLSFPVSKLASNTEYSITLSENIAFEDGAPCGYSYTFTFETGTIIKEYVSAESFIDSVYPENGSEAVTDEGENKTVKFTFNEEMDETTLIPENFVISDSNDKEVSYNGYEIKSETTYEIPLGVLEDNESYKLTVKDIASKSGKMADDTFEIAFSTGDVTQTRILSEIAKIYPESKKDGVTNINQHGFVEIKFSEEIVSSSLDGVILSETQSGEVVEVNSIFEDNTWKFDMCELKSDTEYTITLKADTLKIVGAEIKGTDVESTFKTAEIIDIPQIEGSRIKNVILNKKVLHTCTTAEPTESMTKLNDGDKSSGNEFIMHGRDNVVYNNVLREERYIINLGNTYDICAVRLTASASRKNNYGPGKGQNYHLVGSKVSAGLLNRDRSDAEALFTTTLVGNGDPYYVKDLDVKANYITISTWQADGVWGEFEVFAYVSENYDIAVSNSGNNYTFDISGYNYTDEYNSAQLLVSQYDGEGKLISTKWFDFDVSGYSDGKKSEKFTVTKTGAKMNAVLVDGYNGFKMLTDPIVIE